MAVHCSCQFRIPLLVEANSSKLTPAVLDFSARKSAPSDVLPHNDGKRNRQSYPGEFVPDAVAEQSREEPVDCDGRDRDYRTVDLTSRGVFR